MTEPCDAPISDCGLGPAWSMPSCRTATTEDTVARSSRSRIFGCKPSPRAAANLLNRSDVVISRAPTSCCSVINLNEQHCGIAPFLAFQLASLATTVLCRSRWNFSRGVCAFDATAAMRGRRSGRSESGRNAQGLARAGYQWQAGGSFHLRRVDETPMLAVCAADARTDLARSSRNKGADRDIRDVPDI